MTFQELRHLVRQGEGQYIEFKLKAKYPEKIVKEAVAFANSGGGTLLIGIGDNKTIQGLKFPEEAEYALTDAFERYCNPSFMYSLDRVILENGREILAFYIPKSTKVHYFLEDPESKWGKAYIRIEDKSVKASREMKEIMRRKRQQKDIKFKYGKKEQVLLDYLQSHSFITVSEFCQTAQIPRKVASQTLVLLVLARVLQINPSESEDTFEFIEEIPEDTF